MVGEYYIKNGSYDPETKVSTVTVVTKYGEFTGTAKLHDADLDKESKFFGCRIAEYRALVKYMKAVYKEKRAQVKILKHLQMTVENSNPKDYKTVNIIDRFYTDADEDMVFWKNRITSLKAQIQKEIKLHDETVDKLKEWSK